MEYENLIRECFDTFSIQPTGKNNVMKTKILKKFYQESLREEYKQFNFFEDLIQYALKTKNTNKHELVALIRVEEPKVHNEIQQETFSAERKLLKVAIKNCDIDKIIELTKNNNIDLSSFILSLKKDSPDLLLSDNENNINNLDFKNYPWLDLQSQLKIIRKKYTTNVVGLEYIYKDEKIENFIIKGNLTEIKKLFYKIRSFPEKVFYSSLDYYLNLAADKNNTKIVEFLLNEGTNPSEYAVIQAMKNKNYAMFKLLIIHGVREEKWMDYKCDEFYKKELSIFLEKDKILKMQDKLNDLQKKYLAQKDLFDNKSKTKKIPQQKNNSFLNMFSLEMENLEQNKEEVIFEENTKKPKEKIQSPFDILNNSKLNIKPKPNKTKELKTIINKEKFIDNEMQKKWDKKLISAFANDLRVSMYKLIQEFKEENKEEWYKFKVNGFDLKRFPHSNIKLQWSLSPFRFVCKYLPEMRDILLNETLSEIKNNIDKFTDKINNTNIDTNKFDIKKSTIKKEIEEFKEDKRKLIEANLNRALYEYNKEEYSRHNWKK